MARPAYTLPLERVVDGRGQLGGQPILGYQIEELPEVFAKPASRRRSRKLCTLAYPAHGVGLTFYAGPFRACFSLSVFVFARLGEGWRTDKGLRVGDASSRIRKLYPKAARNVARCGATRMTRLAFIGKRYRGVKSSERPALAAEVRDGKVSALRLCLPTNFHYGGP
jgi:hypothetical protein